MVRRGRLVAGISLIVVGICGPIGYVQWQNVQDNFEALRQQRVAESVRLEDPTVSVGQPMPSASSAPRGDNPQPAAIAKLTVPRFGSTWTRVVYEGTSVGKVLTPLGVGHYKNSAMPGDVGNFALAAHRAGSGGPFRKIDKLQSGDIATVETTTKRYRYRFLQSKVVSPSDVDVISANPKELTADRSSNSLLTLTSCTPIHVNINRYVVWFELISSEPINE